MVMKIRTSSVPLRWYGESEEECALTPFQLKRFRKFIAIFIPTYTIASIVGYYGLGWTNRDLYFSITYLTTIFSIFTLWWDSEILRGIIFCTIPAFWFFWIYWLIDYIKNPTILIRDRLFIAHGPMLIFFTYFTYLYIQGKGTRWWITLGATAGWVFYLCVFKLIDDAIPTEELNFYHGWFPYIWPTIFALVIPSGLITTLIFYVSEKRRDNKTSQSLSQSFPLKTEKGGF